jgi:ectoine hydroxylase-related dioxygenase (phytanoyl-CoA dioxygenase family)
MRLTREQIEMFHRDGVLTEISIDTPDQAAEYGRQFDHLEAAEGAEQAQNKIFDRHLDQQFLWEIASHPRILDCVASLYGPNILLLSTHVFCKYGPTDGFVAWHQDLTYWGLEPLEEVTAWYAVDDSDRENGCMRVIPRQQQQQILEHGKSRQAGNLLSVNQEIAVTPQAEAAAIDCVLRAGEISLHEGTVIHGSLPNRSPRRRCGVTARYVPAHVRPLADGPIGTDWKWRPILVRGEYSAAHFELASAPFPVLQEPDP